MTIIYFHIADSHELNLCSELLNFLLNYHYQQFGNWNYKQDRTVLIERERKNNNNNIPSAPHFLDRDPVNPRALNQFHSVKMKR